MCVLSLAAGCRTSDASTAAPTTASAMPTTPVPNSAPAPATTAPGSVPRRWSADEQAVVDVYQAFLVAFQEASAVNDGALPALQRTATGVLLDKIREKLAVKEATGLRTRKAEPSAARAVVYWVSVNGDAAHLAACVLDDAVVYRVATGEIVDDKVVTARNVARFERTGEVWKVAAQQLKGEETPGAEVDACVAGS